MKIKDKVENLLQVQRYRDSDKLLLLAYWHTQGLHLTKEQREVFLNDCTIAESITRARRELRDKYPESEAVQQERFNKFQQYKNEDAVNWIED